MVSVNEPAGDGLLSPAAQRLYKRITRQEKVDHVLDAHELGELRRWHLITYAEGAPTVPVALSPRDAARRRMDTAMREMAVQLEELAAVPQVADILAEDFQRAQWRSGPGSEFLADVEVVNARLDHVVGSARREILAAQPGGPRTRDHLSRSVLRDTAAVKRGVVKRTLYRDTVRDHPVTAESVRIMSGRGAEYRTLLAPFERCIVVDGREAFISDHVVADAPEHAAWHVTDRAVVGFITAAFEECWRRADPWHGELRAPGSRHPSTVRVGQPGGDGVDGRVRTTGLQREILRDMVAGIKQTSTAARLGVSVRSLQRELDQLRELWGVSTLAELAYRWALSPDHRVDDQIDTISSTRAVA